MLTAQGHVTISNSGEKRGSREDGGLLGHLSVLSKCGWGTSQGQTAPVHMGMCSVLPQGVAMAGP